MHLNVLDEFVEFLAEQWSEPSHALHEGDAPDIRSLIESGPQSSVCAYRPWHWYSITSHRCWKNWKAGGQSTFSLALPGPARESLWWCASLKEASQHYSWTASPHGTFVSLSSKLRAAMSASHQSVVATLCHQILDWGGVAHSASNASRLWIDSQASGQSLINALQHAVSHLNPKGAPLTRFDFGGIDLPMNSATTKLFAAADPNNATLIFDGRVGAALCLLVRRFLEVRAVTKPTQHVPTELLFYWGPHITKKGLRDPSTSQYTFRNINQVSGLERAQASQRANAVAQRLYVRKSIAPDDLERALFMIGYSVIP
jgi:hypothetical protein